MHIKHVMLNEFHGYKDSVGPEHWQDNVIQDFSMFV